MRDGVRVEIARIGPTTQVVGKRHVAASPAQRCHRQVDAARQRAALQLDDRLRRRFERRFERRRRAKCAKRRATWLRFASQKSMRRLDIEQTKKRTNQRALASFARHLTGAVDDAPRSNTARRRRVVEQRLDSNSRDIVVHHADAQS